VLIMQETTAVLARVKELVGEVDFSLHFAGAAGTQSSDSTIGGALDGLNGKGKAD